MRSFTKEDLKQLYLEEEIIKKNNCINSVINFVTKKVIERAKLGETQISYECIDEIPYYYHDEYVMKQIESTLKRIFVDSDINIKTVKPSDMLPPILIVSVDWSE